MTDNKKQDIKNRIVEVSVATIIGLVVSIITTTALIVGKFEGINTRLTILESNQTNKANKEEIAIINTKLDYIIKQIEKGVK